MFSYLVSFGVGLAIGAIYALIDVRSPAPPLIALAGLLGMALGEQAISRMKSTAVVIRREAQVNTALVVNHENRHAGV